MPAPPLVICGLGLVGRRVLEHLLNLDRPVIAIDTHASPDDARYRHPNLTLLVGDCREPAVLERAGVREAAGVFLLTSDDLLNVSTALMIRRVNPDVRIVLRMFNQNLLKRLGKSMRNIVALSVSALAGPRLAMRALDVDVVTNFHNLETGPQQLVEIPVRPGSPLAGRRIGDIVGAMRLAAVGHQPAGREPAILMELDPDAVVSPGDRIWVAGPRQQLDALRDDLGDAFRDGWVGKIRRTLRIARRFVAEIDWTVKAGVLTLGSVILGAASVYHFGFGLGGAESLYRTVSVLATGADMHGNDFAAGDGRGPAQLFVSTLRLLGVFLLAGITAVLTNFLVRARLGSVLELRRVPEWGHVVVCGLGNIGFRVVEELLQRGERVVVIEQDAANPFIPTARRAGAAVVLGDATLAEVLRQAHVATARAVITTTAQELVNLEVALLVAEENPEQRVVLRMSDPALAETLRESGLSPLAVSVPALASPLIVGAMFDERVQTVFRVGGRELAVVDLRVQPGDPCLAGQSLRAAAIDYDMVPLGYVPAPVPAGASSPSLSVPALGEAKNVRLRAGDELTVLTTPQALSRLVRRERVPATAAVEVTACPLPQRETLALLMRQTAGVTAEEARSRAASLPTTFAAGLTPGQASEWLARLGRERIEARVV